MSETGKPLEIERKYLIKMPSERLLAELPECERTEILQIYLVIKQDGVRRRIRRRGTPERGYVCTYTEKSDVSFGVRTEEEREISEEEFERLRAEAAPNRSPIEFSAGAGKSLSLTYTHFRGNLPRWRSSCPTFPRA